MVTAYRSANFAAEAFTDPFTFDIRRDIARRLQRRRRHLRGGQYETCRSEPDRAPPSVQWRAGGAIVRLGWDVSGVVEAVGPGVTLFASGDGNWRCRSPRHAGRL
ncbi:hypothetical protein FOH10_04585 [Nocardia otitidiscaviarum]|uniref:Uncharacterized protein n=1 Tax=Nocardia otitidiscaviarum TaxID=1823 RepID=A0A516NGT5_9NOCA|nr:hypothetical protein FOH10_04585 [Nocardia otitidiscaviarum]